MTIDKRLLEKIRQIEEQLRELRLELEAGEKAQGTPIKIGDRVEIRNPKRGQADSGTVTKVNPVTKRVTVNTKVNGRRYLVVRHIKNITKVQENDS